MASRRHRIDPDARSGGESWVSRPFEPSRQRRWIDSVPPAVGRKGHVCFVIAPRRSIQNTASSRCLASTPFAAHREAISFQTEPSLSCASTHQQAKKHGTQRYSHEVHSFAPNG